MLITKHKVRLMLLHEVNVANDVRMRISVDDKASSQDKRDAFMYAAGAVYVATKIIHLLKPERRLSWKKR